MNNKKIFDNYLTGHYAACEKTNFNKIDDVLQLLKKNSRVLDYNLADFFKVHVGKEKHILDLGCGYGSFLYFLQSHGYKNVSGVDISTEEINICKKIFPSFKFSQLDIFNFLKSANEKFDVIYLSHVLEHIKKDQLFDFLASVKNTLTDDGIFIIIVPNSSAYFNSAANRYGDITHELGFNEISLRQLLMVAEFKNIDIRNYFGASSIWLRVCRKMALFAFETFIQVLGYEKQNTYTPSIQALIRK
ncbi:MAG: class I SAM-dependent methyltransferase [Candidatus Moraniibacteriota bacterium]